MQYVRARGFTLIELLVALALMGILTAIVTANVRGGDARSRDTERKSDLRSLQSAIEQYKLKNGRYPDMGTDTDGDGFASETESADYIVGLASDFIPRLPRDPKPKGADGYVYAVDSAGTVYKLMAKDSVEDEVVTSASEFKLCDMTPITPPVGYNPLSPPSKTSVSLCGEAIFNGNSTPNWCQTNRIEYQKTYAVTGGWATRISTSPNFLATDGMLDLTQQIVCKYW